MNLRVLALLVLVVLPDVACMGISSFYLFPEWATLTASHQHAIGIHGICTLPRHTL